MRNHETGEFEMVVGNRQLLSGFFVIVLLFAMAFAMGYVVGENSRSARPQAEASGSAMTAKAAEPRPEPVAPPTQETPPPPKAADSPPADAPAQPVTQPATQPAREAAPPPAAPPSTPPASAAASDALGEPAPGAYWQVIATSNRDSAQAMVQTLRDKGFPATLSPGPNSLTRVLVGPFTDTASMGRAKSELESAGFNRLVTFRR